MITIFNLIGGFGGGIKVNLYPQDRPTLTAPQTRAAAGLTLAGSLFQVDLTSKNVILSGAFNNGLALNGLNNDIGDPLILTNENSSTTIGTTSNATAAFGIVNVTNNVEYWGKSKTEPLKIFAGSGQSGIQFNPQVGGAIVRIYNIEASDLGYSGMLFSAPSSGGSYFKKVTACWFALDGLVTEGEHTYLGNVSTSTPFERVVLLHNSGRNKGREPLQFKWCEQSRVYNHTYRNVGQVSDTAQQHGIQVEVSKDTIIYDVAIDGCKRSINLFTHDLIVDGGFIRWTSSDGYIGKAETFWPGNANLNGKKVLFRGVTFIRDITGSGYVAQWEETGCNLEFQNCVFSDNINSSIVQDNRAGSPTNTLTGTTTTNGNTSVAKATLLAQLPTYVSDTITSPDFCNITPGHYWFNVGVGKGTPSRRITEIVDAREAVDETVVYGTAYGDLTLPSTGWCLLSTGYWEELPITWAQGSYDGDVAGDYTIYGTPTGYTNTDNIRVEKTITVEAYVNPDTVRVNLAGIGGAYVSSGNWNNIFQNFSSGVQTIKGDNSGETLASLRKVGGALTGYQLNIVTGFDSGALGQAAGGAGVYPDNAILGNWSNPGSSGTSRSFKLTGLDNAKTYTIRILGSAADYLSGTSHLVTVQVSGASGGGTLSNQQIDSNISNVMTFPGCVPTGGEITIRVEKTATGQAYVNVLDFEWS